MGLSRQNNETLDEYIYRVCNEKPIVGYTWEDIQVTANREFGLRYSADKYRKQYNRMVSDRYEVKLPHTESDVVYNDEIDEYNDIQDKINREKIKLRDYRTQNNANLRLEARYDSLRDIALEVADAMNKEKLLSPVLYKDNSKIERAGILAIGDWHYGLDVDELWNQYSPEICRERVAKLRDRVVEIMKRDKVQELALINLGDMISGNIHLQLRLSSRLDVVTQTMEVAEILAEFISDLSEHVYINYYSVNDNHSRVEPNKANSFKPETFARIIDWYVEERLKANSNVAFCSDSSTDIAQFSLWDFNVVAVHGDRDPQKGIIERLSGYLQKHFDLVLSAHLHHFSADENNNTESFCIGSMIGTDEYASSLRLNSKPSQLMIISTPENITETIYKIKLD